MTTTMDKALDAVAKMAPQDNNKPILTERHHKAIAAELKASMNEHREAVECLRMIGSAVRIRGPLGTTAYVVSDAVMERAQSIVSRFGG
jgi:hypothetical protein